MTDRTVRVTLQAVVADYVSKMGQARNSTDEVGGAGSRTATKLAEQKAAMESVGKAGVAFGALLASGVAIAIAKFAEFDAQMSNVQAATGETTENMALLRQAAIDAGASTVFSATEAAGAIEELAKAGVSTADILSGALSGSLDLAAAGQLGVARAAEITSTALNQFELRGDQAAHVADVLAAGAGKAMGSVEDLANGLKFVGPVAASMGVSLEETTGVLALFAQQGIIGEQAGTSLRGVLASLTSPSAQARAEIERLGLTMYDVKTGAFLGLENAAGQLAQAYGTMDGASRDASMGIIFGRETVTAATALYKAGAGGVEEWTQAVDDSGFAAEQARMRLDNLKGDIEALGGAFDSALIQTGSAANDTLRAMVQALTGLVDLYNDLPEPVKQSVLVIGGATAAVTLAGGAALLAVPKWLEMNAAVTKAGLSMGGIALKAGIAGLALGGLFAVVGQLAAAHAAAQARAEAYADTLEDGTHRITEATREMAVENLTASRSFLGLDLDSQADSAQKLGLSLDLVTDAALGDVDALKELQAQMQLGENGSERMQQRLKETGLTHLEYSDAVVNVTQGVIGNTESIEDSIRVAQQQKVALQEGVVATDSATEAYVAASQEAAGLNNQLNELIRTINDANGVGQDAVSANIAYGDALAKVDDAIAKAKAGAEGYSITLDQTTQAGRDNLGMLNDMAQRAQTAAQAQFELDGSTDSFRSTLEAGRQSLIDRAQQLGYNADQAARLADQIFRIPTEREMKLVADTASASRTIEDFKNRYGTIQGVINYRAVTTDGSIGGRASGGIIPGAPSDRDNRIYALATGEFVVRAREVAKPQNRRLLEQMNAGTLNGFASGGFVQPQYASSSPVIRVNTPAAAPTQFPSTLTLEVDGQQFTAYVKGAAGGVVSDAFGKRRR